MGGPRLQPVHRPPTCLAVLLIAACWLSAGPSLAALQITLLCPHQAHHMAGMPSEPCYCSHMAPSVPLAPATPYQAPPMPPVAASLPELPPATPATLPLHPSPAFPPEPPPPNPIA